MSDPYGAPQQQYPQPEGTPPVPAPQTIHHGGYPPEAYVAPGSVPPGYPPNGYPPSPYPPGYIVFPPPQPKGIAISAMVVGIVSLLLSGVVVIGIIGGVVAVVLGIVALTKAQSRGMSITGIATGAIAVIVSVAFFLLSLAFIGGIATITGEALKDLETRSPSATEPLLPSPGDDSSETLPPGDIDWKPVATLNGNKDRVSPSFRLQDGKVRINYDFWPGAGNEDVSFAIYLVPEGSTIEAEGGIPDLTLQEPSAGEYITDKPTGRYTLQVRASGANFSVIVEEPR